MMRILSLLFAALPFLAILAAAAAMVVTDPSRRFLLRFAAVTAAITYLLVRLAVVFHVSPIVVFVLLWIVLLAVWLAWNRWEYERQLRRMSAETREGRQED